MAVYGIGENKCLKEVVSKDNFVVLEGTVTVLGGARGLDMHYLSDLGVTYSEWNPDDWVVVGRMIRLTDDNPQKWFTPYYSGYSEIMYNANPTVRLDCRPIQVAVSVYNHFAEQKRFSYTVVLMKVK